MNRQAVLQPTGFKYHQGAKARTPGISEDLSPTLTADYHQSAVCFQQNQRNEVRLMGGDGTIAGALSSTQSMKNQNLICITGTQARSAVDEECCGTLTCRNDPPVVIFDHIVRRLMPVEYERLQGFPDGWTDWLSPEPPASKIMTANGVPIKKDMTVYVTREHARDCGKGLSLLRVAGLAGYHYGDGVAVRKDDDVDRVELDCDTRAWCPASWLTTERPDCQERIDEDKLKLSVDYWDCEGISCITCDIFNGKRPKDHYGVNNCTVAQGLDLARRQAELDALLGDGTVHCKDCASSREEGHLCYRFAQGVYDEDEGADVVTPVEVEPEGSCSWGRRR